MITVVNKHYHVPNPDKDIYCGRGSKLGNMYSHLHGTKAQFIVSTRDEAVEMYDKWIQEQIRIKNPVICKTLNFIYFRARIGDVNLVCYCAPHRCHCDVIKRIIEQKLKAAA